MKLREWREVALGHTAKLSDINRNLAFAGIAVIWVFKVQAGDKFIIPNQLLLPLFIIAISLMFDLFHYIYQSIVWTLFHRKKENEGIGAEEDIKAPKCYSNIAYVLFFGKVAVNITGFILLFIFLLKALFEKS